VGQPELVEIQLVPNPGGPVGTKVSQFVLNLQVKRAAPPAEAPPARAPAKGGKA
jgi:hypothetical protein